MDARRSRMGTKIPRKPQDGSPLPGSSGGCTAFTIEGNVTFKSGDTSIQTYNLCVVGFGNVGKAFVTLLQKKQQELNSRYGIGWRVTGVASRRLGWLAAPDGFTPDKILAEDFSEAQVAVELRDWLQIGKCNALFETTSLNATTGHPAIQHIRAALDSGAHAISANKGPVIHAYCELRDLAAAKGRRFLFESAVMDGVPIFSLFREAMPAVEVRGFRGVLNSTTNVILEGMEEGMSFEASVQKAQDLGVAESDPTDDIEGVDAAVKVVALANVLMDAELKLDDVQRQGIREITVAQLRDARASGQAWKLVCSAWRETGEQVRASVQPERLRLSDPLAQVRGTSSVISFETDILPQLIITEQDPSVETTAYGLLADFLIAVRSS
jgi:homoserine dehydrogenase